MTLDPVAIKATLPVPERVHRRLCARSGRGWRSPARGGGPRPRLTALPRGGTGRPSSQRRGGGAALRAGARMTREGGAGRSQRRAGTRARPWRR